MELTVTEETVKAHLEHCNKVQEGFHKLNNDDFQIKVGNLVHATSYPRDIIGVVFGYVYCPITNQPRAVLGVNCDVSIDRIRKANDVESITFNMFTKDFNYVESRYTAFLK